MLRNKLLTLQDVYSNLMLLTPDVMEQWQAANLQDSLTGSHDRNEDDEERRNRVDCLQVLELCGYDVTTQQYALTFDQVVE